MWGLADRDRLLFLATFALATGAYAVRGCTGGAAEEQWEKLELGGNPKVVERQELPGQTRIAIQGQGDRVEESGDREESGGGEGSGVGDEPEAGETSTRESVDAGDAGGVAIADDKESGQM